MISCVLIDDQKEALFILEQHIHATPELSLKFSTSDPIEGLNYVNKVKIDLVFIDIQMPDINGLDFIENIRAKQGADAPQFILTTGHSDYALEGYEYGVVDFLLKPVRYARFKKAVDRVIAQVDHHSPVSQSKDFIFLDVDGKKTRIDFNEIVYIEAAGNYVYIINSAGKKNVVYKSTNAIQELLPQEHFIRVHKSYIVALSKIKYLAGNELQMEIHSERKSIPIGVTYKEQVMRRLEIK